MCYNHSPYFRAPKTDRDIDNDCDMPELPRDEDHSDLESFEREEQRMEEEAARVSTTQNIFSLIHKYY